MALTIGIVGLPNVGKSTLFNALTKNQVLAANYPFATIEPNIGVVNLPDPRLETLAGIFGSERILPAAVSFVDIAGIVRGASEGEGLGNKFLANIREADAIAQVVRGFDDSDVVHVEGTVDPKADMETINTELILADLETLERAIPRFEKEIKGRKLDPSVLTAAQEAQDALQKGTPLSAASVDLEPIKELGLLTAKPFIYVFNVDEAVLTDAAKRAALAALVAPAEAVFLDAKIESELIDLDPADAAELLASTGQDESGLDQLARIGLRHARPADLPHGRPQGVARLDHPQGLEGAAGGRRDPHRLRARVHQGRGHLVRRPRRRPARSPRPARRARPAWRARTTSCRTATSWSSASTCDRPRWPLGSAPLTFLIRLRLPLHDGRTTLALRGLRLAAGLRHGFLGGSGRRGDLRLASARKRIPNLVSWVSPCRVKSGCPTSVSSFSIDE